MVIWGQFGHHAFILCIPVHSVKVWKVQEDVVSILSPVAQRPAAELRPLKQTNKIIQNLYLSFLYHSGHSERLLRPLHKPFRKRSHDHRD